MNLRKTTGPRVMRAGALIVGCIALAACATQQPRSQVAGFNSDLPASASGSVIWSSGLQFVALKAQPAGPAPNDQPHSVTADRLRNLLASLKVKHNSSRVRPVFTSEALDKLGPALSKALSTAGPHQDITFAVVTQGQAPNAQMLLIHGREPLMTTGLAYYRNGQLNLIFGKMHMPFEARHINTGRLPKLTPGSRKQRIQSGWAVLGGKQMAHPQPDRPDWVSFAINDSGAPAATPVAATPIPKLSPDKPKPERVQTPVKAPVNTEGGTTYQSIAKRLRTLKRLDANGLITDKEYRQERQKILNSL
ncbi:SHOCT domain-containing protein [Salinisphaera sp. SWV1]|uniref:SHOCT domain-containing protein n=1 Tax=Salinisphaera sp. SWV1 TaxID=3454139 RepID=UPI003F8537FA